MNGNGAYPDEMNEAIVFTDALRAAVPTRPDPRLADTLVPRLAATARTATLEAETRQTQPLAPVRPASRTRSRWALVARVAIAVALIPLLLAGLAVAGVTVPSPARSAFDSVGIDLPNQPRDKSDEGSGAPSSHPSSSEEGTTSGGGVSEESNAQSNGKSQAAHEHARSQRAKAKGKAVGHDRGKAVGLNEATPPGHSGQTGPPAHSNSGGNGGGSSGGASTKAPKTNPAPKAVAKGHSKVPPGRSK